MQALRADSPDVERRTRPIRPPTGSMALNPRAHIERKRDDIHEPWSEAFMSMFPTLAELAYFGGAGLILTCVIFGLVRLTMARRPRP